MNKIKYIILGLSLTLVLGGCGLNKANEPTDIIDLGNSLIEEISLDESEPFTDKLVADKQWNLVELNGKEVDQTETPPYFTLTEENQINGFAGCNNFFGTFIYQEPLQIRFNPLGATLMFCLDTMDLETEFMQVFQVVDNYSVNEDGTELSLNKARMAPLARFVAN